MAKPVIFIERVTCEVPSSGTVGAVSVVTDLVGGILGGAAGAVAGVATITASGGTLFLVGAAAFMLGAGGGAAAAAQIRSSILSFSEGEDDLYIKIDGEKKWPAGSYDYIRARQSKIVNLRLDIPASNKIKIELYDHDTISSDDLLHSFELEYIEATREVKVKNLGDSENGSIYSIDCYIIQSNVLKAGTELARAGSLTSENGVYSLIMQDDGNLCIYEKRSGVSQFVWEAKTWNRGSRVVMQEDGNLVVYAKDGSAVWNSRTQVNYDPKFANVDWKPVRCVLENDGALVLYSATNKTAWSSKQ